MALIYGIMSHSPPRVGNKYMNNLHDWFTSLHITRNGDNNSKVAGV